MTRFFISLAGSSEFVLKCLNRMHGAEIFVPKLPSVNIVDLIKVFEPKPKLKIIGLRPGEKIHETLIAKEEVNYTNEFKNFFIIKPQIKFNKLNNYEKTILNERCIKKKIKEEYSSINNNNFYNYKLLRKKFLVD